MKTRDIPAPHFAYADDTAWQSILHRLPPNLDELAFTELALLRHRKFPHATVLLRLLLAYASGYSMPVITAWAALQGLVTITPEALHYRLKTARHWLAALVLYVLMGTAQARDVTDTTTRRLLLIDGSHATRPGARSQDWRLHLCYDLRTGTLTEVRVGPQQPGESFAQVTLQAGDLLIADRNYGTRANVHRALDAGAALIVRVVPRQFPLTTRAGRPFSYAHAVARVAPGQSAEFEVATTATPTQPAMPGRVVIYHLTDEQAARAAHAQRRRRSRSGRHRPLAAETEEGWQYVVLFTTLPAAQFPHTAVLRRYRFRWQIEVAIKRYKQVSGLGRLRTRLDACCQAELWAKLLLIVLLEQHTLTTDLLPPPTTAAPRPPCPWRVLALLWMALVATICPLLPLAVITGASSAPPYLSDILTTRPRQAVMAQQVAEQYTARYALF